ncbi:MAG TPA: hypothetical protein VN256_07990 [Pyrinomonadaceae bacterium]|nr:hypothetical protein [Pyrinomonadaceae bacterium]
MEGVVWGRVAHHKPEAGFGVEFKKLPPGYEEHIRDIVEFHLEAGDESCGAAPHAPRHEMKRRHPRAARRQILSAPRVLALYV